MMIIKLRDVFLFQEGLKRMGKKVSCTCTAVVAIHHENIPI